MAHRLARSAVKRTLALLTGALMLAGCSIGPTPTPLTRAQDPTVWWSFPAAWNVSGSAPIRGPDGPGITFVSPAPIGARCSIDPPTLERCWPLEHLPAMGVLVASIPLTSLEPQPSGPAWATLDVNGATMRVVRDEPGVCGDIGATETLTTIAPRMSDGAGDLRFVACLTGPDLAPGEAQVRAIFASVGPPAVP